MVDADTAIMTTIPLEEVQVLSIEVIPEDGGFYAIVKAVADESEGANWVGLYHTQVWTHRETAMEESVQWLRDMMALNPRVPDPSAD